MTADDHVLARELAAEAGRRLLELRARGGEQDVLRKAGDRRSHEFLTAELAARRPGTCCCPRRARTTRRDCPRGRVWIVDPLDGTREFGEPGRTDWAVHVALWERTRAGRCRRADRGRGRPPRPGQGLVDARSAIPGALWH